MSRYGEGFSLCRSSSFIFFFYEIKIIINKFMNQLVWFIFVCDNGEQIVNRRVQIDGFYRIIGIIISH